jgi:hypothetical protein
MKTEVGQTKTKGVRNNLDLESEPFEVFTIHFTSKSVTSLLNLLTEVWLTNLYGLKLFLSNIES